MDSRNHGFGVTFSGVVLATLACIEIAHAQYTGRFAVTMSFSPSTSGSYSAADVVVFNTTAGGATSGSPVWSAANLGLASIPNPNIDALSDGTDYLLPPAVGTCPEILIEYTVSSTSAGASGSLIESEKADDGAASDVFSKSYINGFESFTYLANDHQNIAPTAQIDALAWSERPMYPVFFSVDGATASALSQPAPTGLGFTVRPADILTVASPGATPTIFRSYASLGLTASDNIDALAIDFYMHGSIFISLTNTSPSLSAPAYPATSGAQLIYYDASLAPAVFKDAPDLDLLNSDDLTSVRISDPRVSAFQGSIGASPYAGLLDGNESSPTTPFPWNYETIRVDNHVGNAAREIWVESTDPPINISIRTQYPSQTAVVWVGLNEIWAASPLPVPIAKGYLAFPMVAVLPPVSPGNPGIVIPVPPSTLPLGIEINLQGIVSTGLPGEYFMTNIVTLMCVL